MKCRNPTLVSGVTAKECQECKPGSAGKRLTEDGFWYGTFLYSAAALIAGQVLMNVSIKSEEARTQKIHLRVPCADQHNVFEEETLGCIIQ